MTGRQAVVKERKQLLPPTVAPLVVDTAPEGPLLADAPPLLDGDAPPLLDGAGAGVPPSLTTTTRPPPIPDELEDAVRKRSAEEQAEKAKEQIKIARSKKKGDWYKFGFQTKESQAQPKVTIDITVPEGARAGDRLQVTVPQDVDVLEYLGVTEPKPPCVTSEESENSVAKELAGFTLPLLLSVARVAFIVVGRHGGGRRVAADGRTGGPRPGLRGLRQRGLPLYVLRHRHDGRRVSEH